MQKIEIIPKSPEAILLQTKSVWNVQDNLLPTTVPKYLIICTSSKTHSFIKLLAYYINYNELKCILKLFALIYEKFIMEKNERKLSAGFGTNLVKTFNSLLGRTFNWGEFVFSQPWLC